MPQQYVATDSREGLQVAVTGEFPGDAADRVRIARTATLFTRLMATILGTEQEEERRARFRAVETQLEVAEALISGDGRRVRELMRETLTQMGVSEEQLAEAERELRARLAELGQELPDGPIGEIFGGSELGEDAGDDAGGRGVGPLDGLGLDPDLDLDPDKPADEQGEPDEPESRPPPEEPPPSAV